MSYDTHTHTHTNDRERFQLLQSIEPGLQLALDAVPGEPVMHGERPERGQAPQRVLRQDHFRVVRQLQRGQRRARVRSYGTRGEEEVR